MGLKYCSWVAPSAMQRPWESPGALLGGHEAMGGGNEEQWGL